MNATDDPCRWHTHGPPDYASWHEWAEGMTETHEQKVCSGCGLWMIWEPRTTPSTASHSIITPTCRANRGDEGAWQEAVDRAKAVYDQIVTGWADRQEQPSLHLVLKLERPVKTDPDLQ